MTYGFNRFETNAQGWTATIVAPGYRAFTVVLVEGGDYLVASVTDRGQTVAEGDRAWLGGKPATEATAREVIDRTVKSLIGGLDDSFDEMFLEVCQDYEPRGTPEQEIYADGIGEVYPVGFLNATIEPAREFF